MSLSEFQNQIHVQKSDKWRNLYIQILKEYNLSNVLEIGAGTPDFLLKLNADSKFALDGGDKYKESFEENNIKFIKIDLDHDNYPEINNMDLIVSSDVFEHLIYPKRTLEFIFNSLNEKGILISHVPNEFYITSLIKVLLGYKKSNFFHNDISEFENPHIRRFTKMGYLEFLKTKFKYNLYISDFYYNNLSKLFNFLKIRVPYMIEPGPTYISTNNLDVFNKFNEIKLKLKKI